MLLEVLVCTFSPPLPPLFSRVLLLLPEADPPHEQCGGLLGGVLHLRLRRRPRHSLRRPPQRLRAEVPAKAATPHLGRNAKEAKAEAHPDALRGSFLAAANAHGTHNTSIKVWGYYRNYQLSHREGKLSLRKPSQHNLFTIIKYFRTLANSVLGHFLAVLPPSLLLLPLRLPELLAAPRPRRRHQQHRPRLTAGPQAEVVVGHLLDQKGPATVTAEFESCFLMTWYLCVRSF